MKIPGIADPPPPWVWLEIDPPYYKLRNPGSGVDVTLKIRAASRESRVVSATFTTDEDLGSVTGADLRSLPIAAIEAALDERAYSVDAQWRIDENPSEWNPLAPIKPARKQADFLDRVVLQFLAAREETPNPTRRMAELNGVSMTTAQAWVTAARKAGKLPPGRPGRSG